MKKLIILLFATILTSVNASALQPQKGYRGFFDANMTVVPNIGFIAGNPGDSEVFLGFTTSHGYQFNRWLYVGGGVGLEHNLNWHDNHHNHATDTRMLIPIFAEARADAKWGRFTPFLSLRLGANAADHGGIYFSPTVGYRFNWGRRSAINLALGMTLFGRRITYPEYIFAPDGGLVPTGNSYSYTGHFAKVAVRIGFEFQLP